MIPGMRPVSMKLVAVQDCEHKSDRKPGTLMNGIEFDTATKRVVWNKAKCIPEFDGYYVRVDRYGAEMHWEEYGNRESEFGWEIDHVIPISKGGNDGLLNLQPLHWRHNEAKADS